MADLAIVAGATSQSINVALTVLADGTNQTGLAYNSAGLTAYYSFGGANATPVAITLAALAGVTTAWASGGFKEIDGTHMPGVYRLDLPNAALAAGKGREVTVTLTGYSGMATRHVRIELTGWDNQDAARGGLANLDAAVSGVPAAVLASSVEGGETVLQWARKLRAALIGPSGHNGSSIVTYFRKDGTTPSLITAVDGSGSRTAVVDGTN